MLKKLLQREGHGGMTAMFHRGQNNGLSPLFQGPETIRLHSMPSKRYNACSADVRPGRSLSTLESVSEHEGTSTHVDASAVVKNTVVLQDRPFGAGSASLMDAPGNTTWPTSFPDLSQSAMFKHQDSLPRVPVPDLRDTLQKFMRTSLPLLSSEECRSMLQKIRLFLNQEESRRLGYASGRDLQLRLLERAERKPSWLLEWWNDVAYLADRGPVVFYVSYFFGFQEDKIMGQSAHLPGSQTEKAARLVQGIMHFYRELYSGRLDPDDVKGKPLCSHMYKYLFHACRIPQWPRDTTLAYSPTTHHHISILHKGHIYVLDLLDVYGNIMPTLLIQKYLESIISAEVSEDAFPIGLLTSLDRDTWASSRHTLARESRNAELLEKVQNSIFTICLDDEEPSDLEQLSRCLWHGNGSNRFYDKSVQFIVTKNGKAGMLGEHSMMDGMITSRLCETVLAE
jgi:carnitine O-acetyltransferase